MKSLHYVLSAGILATTILTAQARIDRVVEKEFIVGGPGTLKVDVHGGAIKVLPGTGAVVKITAKQKIRADTDAEADEILKKLEFTLEQSGNDVTIISRYERRPSAFHWGSWPPVTVEFEISVPASYTTDLRTAGGSITVGDLQGLATLRTAGGSMALGKLGGTVKAHTAGGSISLQQAGGDIELSTAGGSITVGRVAGTANLRTAGGSIKIESVEHAVQAQTSGGSIRATIAGPLLSDSLLATAGGSVHVDVVQTAAFQLDASTSGGQVATKGLALSFKNSSRSRLAGAVNGGGPLLKLRSVGGGIDIRAR